MAASKIRLRRQHTPFVDCALARARRRGVLDALMATSISSYNLEFSAAGQSRFR